MKKTRGKKPLVRTRIMLPRLGVPARRQYRPNEPRIDVPIREHCRLQCPTRLPTCWHRRRMLFLDAVREDSRVFLPTNEEVPRRNTADSGSRRTPVARWSRTGILQAQDPTRPLNVFSTDKVVLFRQPDSIFHRDRLRRLAWTTRPISARRSI